MTAYNHYAIQLKESVLGTAIISAGGTVYVAKAGDPAKETIYSDAVGTSASNPLTPTRGLIEFYTLSTVSSVDLYIMAPDGQFLVVEGIMPSGPNEVAIDTSRKAQLMKIPFSIADATAATETDTGFNIPDPSFVLDRLHGAGLDVVAADSSVGSKTMDVGTLSTESGGDANGLIAASSTANTGLVIGTNGALFSTNAPAKSDANTAKSISYTLTASAAAVKGFILLPYRLV